MSWAALRETNRPEDTAYCLMGLFRVNMPILYGEGRQAAFRRLQHEIIKLGPDQSIFAWKTSTTTVGWPGILAERPRDFLGTSEIKQAYSVGYGYALFSMTHWGLRIQGLRLFNVKEQPTPSKEYKSLCFALLGCQVESEVSAGPEHRVGIYLSRVVYPITPTDCGVWKRVYEFENTIDPANIASPFAEGKEIFVLESHHLGSRFILDLHYG
jgi:hypothetical protein